MVDRDGNGEVDRVEFLKLCDILLIKVTVRPLKTLADIVQRDQTVDLKYKSRRSSINKASVKLWWRRVGKWTKSLQVRSRAIVLHPVFDVTIVCIVLMYLGVMIVGSTESFQDQDALFRVLEKVFLSIFGFEVFVKLSALGFRDYFRDGWNLFDFSVVLISVVVFVIQETSVASLRSISLLRLARLVRVFTRTMYLMSHVRMLRVLLSTIRKLIRILMPVFVFTSLVIYIMSIFGMEFMVSSFNCPDDDIWCPSFQDFAHALLTCFQFLVGESWGDIMYRGMTAAGHFYYSAFFVMFYLILNILVLNIMAAMVLEVFTIEMDKSQEEEKVKRKKRMEGVAAKARRRKGDYDPADLMFPQALVEQYEKTEGEFLLNRGVRSVFSKYDENDEGAIPLRKVRAVFSDLGIDADEDTLRRAMPDRVDLDSSGNIELIEFLNLHHAVRVNLLFQKYDKDHSGFIDPGEIPSLLHEHSGHVLSEKEIMDVYTVLDRNKDGHVSLMEFEEWWDEFDAKKRFQSFSPDREGRVSLAKMRKLLFATLGQDWVERKSSWIRDQMEKDGELVQLTYEQFRPWYFSIFRHTKHLIDDDDVVINLGKRTDWEATIFNAPANSPSSIIPAGSDSSILSSIEKSEQDRSPYRCRF